MEGFVDCHSHVCPSGDDGAQTLNEGVALCREAARRGTRILFATPHVWPYLKLDGGRERAIRETLSRLAEAAGLELRLGFELTPARGLLGDDPARYALDGTSCVLVEVPFQGSTDLLVSVAEHVESEGLTPVIAHPERSQAVTSRPELAGELADRGWLVQVNGSSLTGREGPVVQALAWRLLEQGSAQLVASDGHREARPPYLDEAFRLACERLGEDAARPLFDGTALGVAAGV